jgi:hypothetical protein
MVAWVLKAGRVEQHRHLCRQVVKMTPGARPWIP